MKPEVNTPHPPQKINVLGRKRYSVDTNAVDAIEYSFNDCWQAIGLLWAVVMALVLVLMHEPESKELMKKFHDGIKAVFQGKSKS